MSTTGSHEDSLQTYFGFNEFRPGQQEVIGHLMAGASAAAVFPTGSGKSLCYQLPALLLDGLTLVVSPLIALMKDQIDALHARGISAARLDSTLSTAEYRGAMDGIRSGQLRLLYVSPERFANERFRQTMLATRISLFAVDEAHCISEWGHNFRPDYLKLAEFARQCQAERILALTATATPQVLDDICEAFGIEPHCATCTGFYRPNLELLTSPVGSAERDDQLLRRLEQRAAGPTIVYVTLQKTAEEVASFLAARGLDAKPYHAGMKPEERSVIQDWFLASDAGIVVATIAFGMGVDKPNIRYVYHYNLPKSLENYSQEIGRAGRDGESATCEMLLCTDDLSVLENFAYGDTPTLASVRKLVDAVFDEGEQFDVSHYDLSTDCDIRFLVVRTMLTYLELAGYIEGGTPFYSSYRFKPLMPSDEILRRFDGERRDFLHSVLREASPAKTWFAIDLDQAALAAGAPRDRVVRALDYLGEQGMLEVATSRVRHRYRRRQPCKDRAALARELHDRAVQREKNEIGRLHQVVALAGHDGCRVAQLCEYFGEQLPQPCGHCSWCLDHTAAVPVPQRPAVALDDTVLQQAVALRQHHTLLNEPDQLARFLCGLTSPQLTRQKLSRHEAFGVAAHVPFQDVLKKVTEAL